MAEEQRCESAPDGHLPCANKCGLMGSPATMNFCSKCYAQLPVSSSSMCCSQPSPAAPVLQLPSAAASPSPIGELKDEGLPEPAVKASNRCLLCRKRVGVMGFGCKCGGTFCGSHRYPEMHRCSYDYKMAGRKEIEKSNPRVVGEKLQRF